MLQARLPLSPLLLTSCQVASIQCSGQALNLACANRVFIVDTWWNAAMEQQAFGRVYRMGQKKETYCARLLVRNSIDVRMNQLQLDKLSMVAKTITESDPSRAKLTREEIASLFGRVVRNEAGEIVRIEADYDDEADEEREEAEWGNGSNSNRDNSGDSGESDEWDQEEAWDDSRSLADYQNA